jgi:hypothetical protein
MERRAAGSNELEKRLEELRTALLEGLPSEGEAAAVAAFVEALPPQKSALLRKVKVAAASVAGVLTLTTGLAAADVLPGPAQDAAEAALEKVGLHLGDDEPDTPTRPAGSPKGEDAEGDDDGADPASSNGQGGTISGIAHDPALQGVEQGQAVCTEASDETCKAGQVHPGSTPGATVTPGPPTSLPEPQGGQGGQGGQGADASEGGQQQADERTGDRPTPSRP